MKKSLSAYCKDKDKYDLCESNRVFVFKKKSDINNAEDIQGINGFRSEA